VCQVISGKAIVFCPLITVSVLPPNRRVQSTPLRGRKIVAILKSGFVPKLISLYQCGAADAQHVGPATSLPVLNYGISLSRACLQ
jgi:hypothetical protein